MSSAGSPRTCGSRRRRSRGARPTSTGLLTELRLFSKCVVSPLDPAGDVILNDQFSTGSTNFEDFLHAIASQGGILGNIDGNGSFLRIQTGGGPVEVSTPIPNGNDSPFGPDNVNYGTTIEAPIGTQPLKPAKNPPIRTDVPCFTNDIPALNGPQAAVGGPSPVAYGP